MKNKLRKLLRTADFLLEPGVWPYWRTARARSISSYRICRAVAEYQPSFATILDVGANQGQFANAAAHRFPSARIWAFEPVPTTVSILRRNVAHLPQVEVLAVALGASSGRLKFYSSKYSHASSARSVHPNQLALEPETGEVEEIEVPVSTLDQFMAVRQTAGPVLLKLDVQGFESEVIRGGAAALARIDYLLFEASYVPLYEGEPLFEEMHALARAHGFTLVGPVGFLEDPAHRLLQADLLYRRQAIR